MGDGGQVALVLGSVKASKNGLTLGSCNSTEDGATSVDGEQCSRDLSVIS